MGWLDNAARQSRLNRLRRASYKLPLQVPAAKIVIDDPVELKYEAVSCCCKDSVLTKVLTKVLLVDVEITSCVDLRSRGTSEKVGPVFLLFMPIFSRSLLPCSPSAEIRWFSGDAAEGQFTSSPASGRLDMKPSRPRPSSGGPVVASYCSAGLPNDLRPSSRKRCSTRESSTLTKMRSVTADLSKRLFP